MFAYLVNHELIFALLQNKPGSADVLRAMEMFALQAARRLSREDMAEPTITNNIGESGLLKEAQIASQNFPFFSVYHEAKNHNPSA